MTTYADYNFYSTEYGGKLDEDTFNRLSKRGATYITQLIGNREFDTVPEPVKMAHCAVVDVIGTEENGGEITSQTVGEWSQTYAKPTKTGKQRMYDAAMTYLSGTGIICRWV